MHRNSLIVILAGIILAISALAYYRANYSQWIYSQYRGEVSLDLPLLRTRSLQPDQVPNIELENALVNENYALALEYLETMISDDETNNTLRFYEAVLHEQLGQYLKAIDEYQIVRLNSDLFDRAALRRLALLYIKINDLQRAHEMLSELQEIGEKQDDDWARRVQQQL
jgi:tetratricopeptide (TPR) repeat protein